MRPPTAQRAAEERLAREYFLPFVKLTFPRYAVSGVSKLIAWELERFEREVAAGRSPRLILELPPRVGKSELVSRRYPGWLLGRHPDWHIGLVSYGADLAERLSRDARRVVMSEVYARVFAKYELEVVESVEIDRTSKSVSSWNIAPSKDNPQPGGLIAVGVNGTITGQGVNVMVLDDPLKNWIEANSPAAKDRLWDYYTGTLYDRIEPGGGIIIVQQRWALDDLVGRVLDQGEEVDEEGFEREYLDEWRRITVPAQALAGQEDALGRQPGEWLEGRYTDEQWERAKANNLKRNPRVWWAKFQQQPTAPEGVFFQPYQWIRFEEDPEEEGPVFVFGDTSYAKRENSDFNCFGVWRYEQKPKQTFRLLEVYRKRSKFPELRRDLVDICFRHGLIRPVNVLDFSRMQPRVFIEDKKSGQSLIQEFMVPVDHPTHGRVRLPVAPWNPDKNGDKDMRAHAVTPMLADGMVAMPKQADWLAHLIRTMTDYQGEGTVPFDDEIDMLSMSLILLGNLRPAKRARLTAVPFEMVS